MGSLLIKNIHSLVTCNGEDRILRGADVYCEDGFIRAIGRGIDSKATLLSMAAICFAIPAL